MSSLHCELPLPTILEDDNVACHSRWREDNSLNLNSVENTVSFDAIHGSCLGKSYCFFHLLTAAASTTWARPERWTICASQVELQMVLTPHQESQVHCSSEAVRLILWLRQMVLQWLESECNFKFCFQRRELWFLFPGLGKKSILIWLYVSGIYGPRYMHTKLLFKPILGVGLNPAASKLSLKYWDELV